VTVVRSNQAEANRRHAFEFYESLGEIDVFVLNDCIHKFHDGVSRDLYKRYAMGESEWSVASAIARNVLKESEIDHSILNGLRSVIELARQMRQEDEEA
jgi:hypothetical protein